MKTIRGEAIKEANEQLVRMRHARSRDAYLTALCRRQVALDAIAATRDGRLENTHLGDDT